MTIIFPATPRVLSFAASTSCGAFALLGSLLLPACSTNYLTDGVIMITTGQEPDAWTVEPAARSVKLEMVQSTRTTLANVAAPVTNISIGTDGPQNAVVSFDATGFDEAGNVVMKGSTVPLGIVGFNQAQIPLFMGRVAGLARAPGDLVFPWRHPQLAILYHGHLLISGGDGPSPNLDIYDMVRWQVAPQQSPLPKIPESWAVSGSTLLLIDHQGATWFNIGTYATSAVDTPVGLDYGDLVGGQTIGDPGDPQYIVGATRTAGTATDVVLRVDSDATLHLMKLNTPRLGAAAAMVNGQLLVVGGADSGAGAEVSNADGTAFTQLPFPADATQGAALVEQDATSALLVGGKDPASDEIVGFRTMDLGCSDDCTQLQIKKPAFPFEHPRLFPVREGQSLAAGEDAKTGQTRVFTFDAGIGHALNEVALKVPRAGASVFMSANGQVGVLGGDALADGSPVTSMELFFPQP